MKGCLSNLIKLTIFTFAVIGFLSIGGGDFIKTHFKDFNLFKKSQETLLDKANKIADFNNINTEEYEISKAANFMGYKTVIAEHNASGQKFFIIDSSKDDLLTKKDFENNMVDEKIKSLTKKLEKQFIHLEDVKIIKKSSMYGLGQNIPYVKIEATPTNMPTVKKVSGIIGAYEKDGNSNVILSVNTDNKYSQIITEQFFKDVK